ncbi:MAG: hypothetical protein RLP09_41695, partial [Sandaracinaceae bacterium]
VRRATDALAAAAQATTGGPALPTSAHADPEKLNTPERIRTSDQRLRKPVRPVVMPEGYDAHGRGVDAAREVLVLASAGQPIPAALIEALRAAVLEREDVRLALALDGGGPHRARAAIELAGMLAEAQGGQKEREG